MKIPRKVRSAISYEVRNALGIRTGEMLDVCLDEKRKCIEMKVPTGKTMLLAGSLSRYASGKIFPDRKKMNEYLKRGLAGEK